MKINNKGINLEKTALVNVPFGTVFSLNDKLYILPIDMDMPARNATLTCVLLTENSAIIKQVRREERVEMLVDAVLYPYGGMD